MITLSYRHQYRYYTRLIKNSPSHSYYHKQRIKIARNLVQTEPLQGAVADYFLGCWYDANREGKVLLEDLSDHLPAHVVHGFLQHVNTGKPIASISVLATRYSVLVSPSMNVPKYKLYLGKDDAKIVSKEISLALLKARSDGDLSLLHTLEQQYLQHCLACQDKMGFLLTWFALAKESWHFHEEWLLCKSKLEQ